jgi:hypothetical protein
VRVIKSKSQDRNQISNIREVDETQSWIEVNLVQDLTFKKEEWVSKASLGIGEVDGISI